MPAISRTIHTTIESRAPQAFERLDASRPTWNNEAKLRIEWVAALQDALGVNFDAEVARVDSNYNNVFIEFKAKGLFKGSAQSAAFKEAMQRRLLPYILEAAKRSAYAVEDYIGVAIDGDHICFAQVVGDKIEHNHLLPFSRESVGMVLEACRGSYRRAVDARNLLADFGHSSPAATEVMQALADALARAMATPDRPKIKMLFEEWRDLYGQVADLSSDQVTSIDKALRFKWQGERHLSMPARLFVIHTYNSLIIKLLAAEIVSAHGLATLKSPAENYGVMIAPSRLIDALEKDIEHGGLFSGAGIKGFVEEAIFSWHIDAAREPGGEEHIVPALRALIGKLALYRTDRLANQRDALRDFYQGLVPETMRKSLGEFYTPDWLVDFTVEKATPKSWKGSRYLDPTCGSGSFLMEVVRRKRRAAEEAGTKAEKLVDALVDEVWGFDLNPLAVQTSRVNFLMAIADLLAEVPGKTIELPILLADAIYSPAPNPNAADEVVSYRIGSQVASLNILLPAELAFKRQRLDAVFDRMGASVEKSLEYAAVSKALVKAGELSADEAQRWAKPLRETYDQVLKLHKKKWNGIWFRIVRNFFWSATAGEFDFIVGNPPWVRWSRLPEAYRERVKPTCEKYDIFSKTGHHGGNELDISAMITYTTGDKWLKQGGKIAFVITQALFQNPSSAGFRNFRVDRRSNLIPLEVEDLKALKPFRDAANKTCVAVLQKTKDRPTYPVPYSVWRVAPGYKRNIDPDLPLDEVVERVVRDEWEATPVGGEGSPWAVLPEGRFSQIKQLAKPGGWVEGRKGITVDLNGVYFVPIVNERARGRTVQIRTQPASGKKDIGAEREAWIEPDWLFPLIKGASDFDPCYLKPDLDLFALVPNSGIKKSDYRAAEEEAESLPKTLAYFEQFEELLADRSTWKSRMRPMDAPIYAIYNVGAFTFKPWKVIWAEMPGRFCAAVAGSKDVPFMGMRPYVPDHKIFFVALDDETEAHYLCALLNSTTVSQYVEAHNVAIQVGDVFKHMRLPPFDPKDKGHVSLAGISAKAHAQPDATARRKLVEQIRKRADELLDAWIRELELEPRG